MARVDVDDLLALQRAPGRVRNMCILAHVDHGKTTLADLLVSSNGIISERQAGRLRFLDSTEEEQKRGITMRASAISLLFKARGKGGGKGSGKGASKGGKGAGKGGRGKGTASDGSSSGSGNKDESKGETDKGAVTSAEIAVEAETPLPPLASMLPAASAAAQAAPVASGAAATSAPERPSYLINLIDSPGHVDFCSDVSSATRLCDGALVVVDVVEGVCVQTHAVLRQAWAERMKPCLVLNKVDRLCLELQLSPHEAWHRLRRTVERVNSLAAALVSNEAFDKDLYDDVAAAASDSTPTSGAAAAANSSATVSGADFLSTNEATRLALEEAWTFSPEKGNVVFASAYDGWAFSLSDFARMWSTRLPNAPAPRVLKEYLWGDFAYNKKSGKVVKLRQSTISSSSSTDDPASTPMFVSLVLNPIWQLYNTAAVDKDGPKALKMATQLGVELRPHEASQLTALDPATQCLRDGKGLARALLRKWLPLAPCVLQMAVDAMPSPEEAQPYRLPALFEGGVMVGGAAGGVAAAADAVAATAVAASSAASGATAAGTAASSAAAAAVHHAVGQCSSDALAPTVVFVSKLMSVPAVDVRQRIATTDSATAAAAAAGGGGLQRLTGALWKAPRRVQFDPSDPTDNNDDADADDDDDEEGSSGAAGGAAAGVASGSYGSGDNSSLPGQGKEMLLAFARVFSGVLRASDFGDDVTPAEVFEKNMASYTGSGSGSCNGSGGEISANSAQPLFLLGPKHQPLEASESSTSNTAATTSTTAANTNTRTSSVTVAPHSATDGGDSDDVISHVVALTPCAGQVLAGRADVILPPPPPLSSHPVTSSSSSTSLATSSVNEAPAAAAPASEAQSERQAQQRSPIALYLMMGDALEPVAEVPAGNLCAIAGLDKFHVAKCATLIGGVSWAPFAPSFKALAVQARPMLRVAVEATSVNDLPKLERGLKRLHRADPAVEVETSGRGEQVVAALGELHLEQCLKDLRERHARCPIKVSPPLLSFREGLEDETDQDGDGEGNGESNATTSPTAGGGAAAGAANELSTGADLAYGISGSGWGSSEDLVQGGDWEKKALPPALATIPWSQTEESGSWALAGGGAARCVSADGSFAVTLRCVPLQAHLARTIDEAHPNVVMAAVGAAASAAAAVAAVATNSVPSVDTAAAIAAAEDPISSNRSSNNRQHSLATLLRAGARDAVTSSASISNSSNSSAKLVGVGPRGIGPNMLVLRGPQEQEQAEGEDTGKNSGDETEASSLAVVRVHPSSAALCRFAACDPRARRSVLATPLKVIAKAQISTASAAASGAASAASSGSSSSLAASHAIDEEWALGYSSSNNNNDEDGEGSASEAFSKSNAAYSASAPPCTFATLSPKAASAVWRRISQHVASGFQLATANGPLAEEPLYGTCFVIEAIDVTLPSAFTDLSLKQRLFDGSNNIGSAGASASLSSVNPTEELAVAEAAAGAAAGGMLGGLHVAKATRLACRAALLSHRGVRLVEGHYRCDLQCAAAHLGALYGVLNKRRGVVIDDDVVEGTDLFVVRAHLPVVESLGFGSELLSKTSGAATAPLLRFSHWSSLPVDPFWRPTSEDERDEHGEAYASHEAGLSLNLARRHMDNVRRRKGLPVEEKAVASAEKQRTLSRNK